MVKLKSFLPFTSAEKALMNINAVSEGEVTEDLVKFLELNMPKKKAELGVHDPKLGNSINETCSVKCKTGKLVAELLRGIRIHFDRFIKGMKSSDLKQAQLGLGHSYSRAKVKFNVHRVDNMIVQSIALLDQLDKDINTFSMRVRFDSRTTSCTQRAWNAHMHTPHSCTHHKHTHAHIHTTGSGTRGTSLRW